MKNKHALTVAFIVAFGSTILSAQTVTDYMVVKLYDGVQTSSSGSVFNSPAYGFFAEVSGTGLDGTYQVATPGGSVSSPITLAGDAGQREYEQAGFYANIAGLNSAYNNGVYTFTLPADDGPFFPTLTLTGDAFPGAFSITNGTWADGKLLINPALDYTITFDGFGGMVNGMDFIILNIDTVGGFSLETNTAGTTSFTINGGTLNLLTGQTTMAELAFIKVVDFDDTAVSGATGIAAYATIVGFQVQAVPEPSTYAAIAGALALCGAMVVRRRRT